jgi:hypothetical protein
MHYEGGDLYDHCGRPTEALETFLDEEGSVLIRCSHGIGLLDDRDLERYVDSADRLTRIARAEVEKRFGFVSDPANAAPDSLR